MPRKLIDPETLHEAPGFSHIAIAEVGEGSRLVNLAGQVALDKEFKLIGGDDLRAQTVAAINNVSTALEAAGAGWDDVIRRTIYTKQPGDFAVIAEAIESVLGPGNQPPQTILGVTGLVMPELLIEIEVTALLKA